MSLPLPPQLFVGSCDASHAAKEVVEAEAKLLWVQLAETDNHVIDKSFDFRFF
jgi:predicted CoA-binding protein